MPVCPTCKGKVNPLFTCGPCDGRGYVQDSAVKLSKEVWQRKHTESPFGPVQAVFHHDNGDKITVHRSVDSKAVSGLKHTVVRETPTERSVVSVHEWPEPAFHQAAIHAEHIKPDPDWDRYITDIMKKRV